MRLADFDLLSDEERQAAWDSVHEAAKDGLGWKRMLRECAEADVAFKMRWGRAIDPNLEMPLATRRLEIMTAQLRTDLAETVALVREAKREWTSGTRGASTEWLNAVAVLVLDEEPAPRSKLEPPAWAAIVTRHNPPSEYTLFLATDTDRDFPLGGQWKDHGGVLAFAWAVDEAITGTQ